jgi:hypothetical protein
VYGISWAMGKRYWLEGIGVHMVSCKKWPQCNIAVLPGL